jgi:3-oxoadipate enol-lactonase
MPRGYGDSDDYVGEIGFNDFARDLSRVLDHFGVEKSHIAGLSMGGRISQSFT